MRVCQSQPTHQCSALPRLAVLEKPDSTTKATAEQKKGKSYDEILSTFDFTAEELDEYAKLPTMTCFSKIDGEYEVPVAYIRAKAHKYFTKAWLNSAEATHNLLVTDFHLVDEVAYPINEVSRSLVSWKRN